MGRRAFRAKRMTLVLEAYPIRGPFMSKSPARMTAAASTRRTPNGSRRTSVPMRAPKSTDVSRKAVTCAIGPRDIAQIAMP
ncbi:hypothetical protein D3C83_133110 [compost metagenome]